MPNCPTEADVTENASILDPQRKLTHGQVWSGRFRQFTRSLCPDVRICFWIEPLRDEITLLPAAGQRLFMCPETNYSVCQTFECRAVRLRDIDGVCCTIVKPWVFSTSVDWVAEYFDDVHTNDAALVMKCATLR